MRDPSHPLWPDAGERTELADVAEVWRRKYWRWVEDRDRERLIGRRAPRTFGKLLADYLSHREGQVEAQTYKNDRSALNHLATDHPPSTIIERLEPQRTIDRMLREGYAPSTVRVTSAFLSSFWTWLDLPYSVKLPRAVRDDVRVWSSDEIGAIREAAERVGMLLPIDVGLYIGLRRGEIWGLEWPDVKGWTVRVRRQFPDRSLKGKRARTAIILKGWEHTGATGRVCAQHGMDAQCRRVPDVIRAAGLEPPHKSIHSLRHTYSRMFLEAKPDLRLLQASLGHASIRITEDSYGHLTPDRAAEMTVEAMHGG